MFNKYSITEMCKGLLFISIGISHSSTGLKAGCVAAEAVFFTSDSDNELTLKCVCVCVILSIRRLAVHWIRNKRICLMSLSWAACCHKQVQPGWWSPVSSGSTGAGRRWSLSLLHSAARLWVSLSLCLNISPVIVPYTEPQHCAPTLNHSISPVIVPYTVIDY